MVKKGTVRKVVSRNELIDDKGEFIVFIQDMIVGISELGWIKFSSDLDTNKYIWQRDILKQAIESWKVEQVRRGLVTASQRLDELAKRPFAISRNSSTNEISSYQDVGMGVWITIRSNLNVGTREWNYFTSLPSLIWEVEYDPNKLDTIVGQFNYIMANYGKKYGIDWTDEGVQYITENATIPIYHYSDGSGVDNYLDIDDYWKVQEIEHERTR